MKLIKPILTAGAAVAMLCACGGGKKEITFDQFKQKITIYILKLQTFFTMMLTLLEHSNQVQTLRFQ